MTVFLAHAHEKSPLSFGRRAFLVRAKDRWSAPDAEESIGDHPSGSQATDDRQDDSCRSIGAVLRTGPVVRPDQVDGDGGFAYVGRLFHGRQYSLRPKAWLRAGHIRRRWTARVEAGVDRAKKYPHERAERALTASKLLSLGLSCSMRDSRSKMPRRMEATCNSGASGM